jgi:enoyl-CoA hydratase/carnithine racemase
LSDENAVVLIQRQEAIAWLTLNRPQQINAINEALRTQLPAVLAELDADETIRVIVVHGAGERGFCAGADIREFSEIGPLLQERRKRHAAPWARAFDRVSKPIIAAIHGYCLGGGLEIALSCDIRMAAQNAQFALPEVGLGVIPGYGGTQRLARLIGMGPAMDLLLSGRRIDATEAFRLGLVTRIVDSPEALRAAANDLADELTRKPPHAVSCAKEALRTGWDLDLQNGLALERDLFTFLSGTEDRLEAAAAFREKRAPRFTGR